ncbi:hypothetical protein NP233_g920 [Leucocoprinus birnbaumii]|uniref:Uncharacterized protein n=1 Tax=Leucocoprinus birnbaumii TaxID=56174 RepID=A0AAD5YVC4_9AGAR|nr:hypothetical protein NP233_g920 [Leucocoprinus birnbaumii]
MLRLSYLRSTCKPCLPNLHPRQCARNFLSSTRPVAARSKSRVNENVALEKENIFKDALEHSEPQVSRVSPPQRSRPYNVTALNTLELSPEDRAVVDACIADHLDPNHSTAYPHDVFEDVLQTLIDESRFSAAMKVHQRVVAEGLIVSPSLEAQMLAVSISQADKQKAPKFLDMLKAVVKRKAIGADDLVGVLSRMSELDLPSEMLMHIMSSYNEAHPILAASGHNVRSLQDLAKFIAEDSDAQTALDALAALPELNADEVSMAEAYTSFFRNLRASAHPDRSVVSAALDQMEKHGVEPNLSIWNSLIAFEVRANSLHRPFAMYYALKARPDFLPDQNTFGSLFKALNRFYNPKRRRFRYGRRLPDNIPSPRGLFREMMDTLVRHADEPKFRLSTSFLNTILRTFVFQKDYAGAYLVLRSYRLLDVPVNVKTYLIVFRHLMNRITYGIRALRKMGSVTWADRFLSLPYPVSDPAFLRDLQLSNALASHILESSVRQSFDLERPLYINIQLPAELGSVKYQSPTALEMLGKAPISLDAAFDPEPLERLMKKAMFAEIGTVQELGPGQVTSPMVSKAIVDAKEEMIHPTLHKQLKKIREELRTLHLIQLARLTAWANINTR